MHGGLAGRVRSSGKANARGRARERGDQNQCRPSGLAIHRRASDTEKDAGAPRIACVMVPIKS